MSANERTYNFSDAELIENAEVTAETLPEDIAEFTAFDSTIDAEYPSEITEALELCYSIKSDTLVVNEQAELTLMLNDALSDCNKSYKTIAYFVRKAFDKNMAVQMQFGLKDMSKIRNRQAKLILFMEALSDTALKYKAELVSEGCNASVIDLLPTKVETLKKTNIDQKKAKKNRNLVSQDRVNSLNSLYSLVKTIHDIALIIYADDPAKLSRYSLPTPKSSTNNPDDIVQS